MTLTATWIANERSSPTLWMASDSRINDGGNGPLIEEGVKLFELPVVCRRPGPSHLFDEQYFATTLGLACCGSTLVFQQVYATLVSALGRLGGFGDLPTLTEIAELVGRVMTFYVRSLGANRPRQATAGAVLAGRDPVTGSLQALDLCRSTDADGMVRFEPSPLDLERGRVHFAGDAGAIARAKSVVAAMRADPQPGQPNERVALNALRALIDDSSYPTVGGDIQLGLDYGSGFQRHVTVTPPLPGSAAAQSRLNNIDMTLMWSVGPCRTTLQGMISP